MDNYFFIVLMYLKYAKLLEKKFQHGFVDYSSKANLVQLEAREVKIEIRQ